MMKAMWPINKNKGNEQASVVAGGCPLGALCGAVGVAALGGCSGLGTYGVPVSPGAPPWPPEPVGFGKLM